MAVKFVMPPRLLYTSFDRVPGCKGANTHIEAFVRAIGNRYGSVVLITPGPEDVDVRPFAPGVRQLVVGCPDDNPIGRARTFRVKLTELLRRQPFELIHFRSNFEGYPLVHPQVRKGARLLYEANGFPSVELKYHYAGLIDNPALVEKLRRQEAACLQAADAIVTVSDTNRQFISERGIPADKISVIPNGVDPTVFSYRAPPAADGSQLEILYLGTLSWWQGIETLIQAVALVARERSVRLRLVGVATKQRRQELEQLVDQLEVGQCVEFGQLHDSSAVAQLLHESHMTVVPLLAVDRNTRQGCCPLKLLEAMFSGCPVIAADLPVVRELADPLSHYLPIRSGDAGNLKNAILQLADDRALALRLSRQARDHVAGRYTWTRANEQLLALYDALLLTSARMSATRARSPARL